MRNDDEVFLDELFDRAAEEFRAGNDFELDGALDGREHLRERAEESLANARALYRSRRSLTLDLPGYTIERELGRGSMGVVYLARQSQLGDRRVALKVLPSMRLGADRARQRFLGEARAIARIRHPGVISIYDVVEDEDWLAYAMDWVAGEDLASWIQDGGGVDRVSQTTAIGAALARALEAVHGAGLLHRDVKPSNVLLRTDGTPVLIDFGLVKDQDDSMHTRSGAFLGTLAYAAPEQIRGDEIDERADVYGLGATLYHALAGRLPFEGSNSVQILSQIEAFAAVPLRRHDKHLPRDLETVVAKAMEFEPGRRYGTAGELAEDLERILALRPVLARPVGVLGRTTRLLRRNAKLVAGVATGFVITLVAVLSLLGWRTHREGLRARALELTREARITLLETRPLRRMQAARVSGYVVDQELVARAIEKASRLYDESLDLLASQPQARAERSGISRALTSSTDDDGVLPQDLLALRAEGIEAYCTGQLQRAIEALEAIDTHDLDDPFLEGLLGHVYMVQNLPARAYHRLRVASDAFPDAGSLHLLAANAALRCGETADGAALLDRAQSAGGRLDGDLLSAVRFLIDHRSPDAGQVPLPSQYPLVQAELAESEGRFADALTSYVNLMPYSERDWRIDRGILRCARSWWERRPATDRITMLEGALNGEALAFGSLLGLLANVEIARTRLMEWGRRPTLFTVNSDALALDPAIAHGDPAFESVDGLAQRAAIHRLDTEGCAQLDEALRTELVRLWTTPGMRSELERFLESHDLVLPPGQHAFGTRIEPAVPPFNTAGELQPMVYMASEFWRYPFAEIGDLDGDLVPDALVYSATELDSSSPVAVVRAVSARNGSTLYSCEVGPAFGGPGSALSAFPDIDCDGSDEWICARLSDSPRVVIELRSGADGELIDRFELPTDGGSGGSYLAVLRGNPRLGPGIAVSDPRAGDGDHGQVLVVEADGTERFTLEGETDGLKFGNGLASLGDIDGDGIGDLAVGSEPQSGAGAFVEVFSGASGRTLHRFGGLQRDFGWRARPAPAGDVDGDGVGDIAVGCFPGSDGSSPLGRALVYSGSSGALLLEMSGERPHEGFGEDVYGLGDLDGDGRGELAVTSWGTRSPRPPRVEVFDAWGKQVAVLPTFWRLRPLGEGRVLALRLGIWSRYANARLGGEGSGAILEWAGE